MPTPLNMDNLRSCINWGEKKSWKADRSLLCSFQTKFNCEKQNNFCFFKNHIEGFLKVLFVSRCRKQIFGQQQKINSILCNVTLVCIDRGQLFSVTLHLVCTHFSC